MTSNINPGILSPLLNFKHALEILIKPYYCINSSRRIYSAYEWWVSKPAEKHVILT